MRDITRRGFLRAGAGLAAAGLGLAGVDARGGAPLGELAAAPLGGIQSAPAPGLVEQAAGVEILSPRARVPLSFFIDDSTCLVNMGHFCMPQFAEAWPDRDIYRKPWKTWPREIPDSFVRQFAEFCSDHAVKGKYSLVPYPCCVGWLDRELPGWSRRDLLASLKLVRDQMLPNWDIHPEMITHTRVIDLTTGRPLQEISSATMENSYPRQRKSADELAAYLAYALRILKNCDLPCEGITTPGGFGNAVKSELSQAVGQAVRDVYAADVPHYFKYVSDGRQSTAPKLEHVADADTDSPRLVVNVPAATGDWFGNWDGDAEPQGHRYANDDASAGRLVELIQQGEPAVMLCHWPGLYSHGTRKGFDHFRKVILALQTRFADRTVWMKISELARYYAAKGLTRIRRDGQTLTLTAPFAAPRFTLRLTAKAAAPPAVRHLAPSAAIPATITEVKSPAALDSGTWLRQADKLTLCFDLPKGKTVITAAG